MTSGLAWKDNVRVASTANLNLASPGATIDGVTMAVNDRVLVKDQTAPEENGLYGWNGAAVAMTRTTDADSVSELRSAIVSVDEGTANGDTTWRQTALPATLGTDPVVWAAFGADVPQATETLAGKAEIATQGETDTGTDDQRIVTPAKLANWAGRGLEYAADIGDGVNTQYTVSHSFGSRDVQVIVRENSGAYRVVEAGLSMPTTNTVQVDFASAPSLNAYRVYISKR